MGSSGAGVWERGDAEDALFVSDALGQLTRDLLSVTLRGSEHARSNGGRAPSPPPSRSRAASDGGKRVLHQLKRNRSKRASLGKISPNELQPTPMASSADVPSESYYATDSFDDEDSDDSEDDEMAERARIEDVAGMLEGIDEVGAHITDRLEMVRATAERLNFEIHRGRVLLEEQQKRIADLENECESFPKNYSSVHRSNNNDYSHLISSDVVVRSEELRLRVEAGEESDDLAAALEELRADMAKATAKLYLSKNSTHRA